MVSASSASRYQRRIFGLGVLGTVLLLVIGAPIFNNRIEDDLERRVPSELAEAGFSGITATFSGQDGTLRCAAPLDDPERAIEAAYDVWGVRAIVIDRSCRVNRAPTVETTTTVVDDGDQDGSGATPVTTGDDELVDNVPTALSAPPDFDTVAGIVATSPQLSLLSVLIEEAGHRRHRRRRTAGHLVRPDRRGLRRRSGRCPRQVAGRPRNVAACAQPSRRRRRVGIGRSRRRNVGDARWWCGRDHHRRFGHLRVRSERRVARHHGGQRDRAHHRSGADPGRRRSCRCQACSQ